MRGFVRLQHVGVAGLFEDHLQEARRFELLFAIAVIGGAPALHVEQEAAQARMQSTKQAYERTWAELQKDGIDRDKLAKIYGNVTKNYGFSEAELASVYDHRQVRLMKDAIAFRELQAQKAAVTKKVQEAPRMPSKQTRPAQTRQDQALENKFKGGRAKLNDLAAYLR